MGILELFILAVGLAMDAFAVSICRGVMLKNIKTNHMIEAGLYFGGFQAMMPLLGYMIGIQFYELIKNFDHWIAFLDINIILAAIFIGVVTFILSGVGVKIGSCLGNCYQSKAEMLGGLILVSLGIKIFIQHMWQ